MNLTELLTSIPPIAVYLIAGAAVAVESLGVPVPGEVVLVTAALLASHGELAISPHGVAIAAVIGAVCGDSIGYEVGRHYGDRLFAFMLRRFPRHVTPELLAYAQHVFHRYGMLAVFAGRFIALLRILSGPLSGSLGLHYPRFLIANLAGAICWAGGTTYLVYALGKSAERYLKEFSYLGLGIAVVLAILLSTVLRRRMRTRIERFTEQQRAQTQAPEPD